MLKPYRSTSAVQVLLRFRSGSPYAPISYATFRGEDLHTTLRIPVPHAIEGYGRGYRLRGRHRGVNQYERYSTSRSSWAGTPLQQPPPQPQPQPVNRDDGKRHKLDQEITEEELRKRSSEQQEIDDEVSNCEGSR